MWRGANAIEEEAGMPLDLPAEFLIGVQENDAHDPVDVMLVFQKQLEIVTEAAKQINAAQQQRERATNTDESAAAAASLAAAKATHGGALVDVRKLALKMGNEYQEKLDSCLSSARMKKAEANTPRTLHIKSGKPMNMFQAPAWSAAFVQFFYGDCAPNLDRPRRIGMRELSNYLANREELEYT